MSQDSDIFEKHYNDDCAQIAKVDFGSMTDRLGIRHNGNQIRLPFFNKDYLQEDSTSSPTPAGNWEAFTTRWKQNTTCPCSSVRFLEYLFSYFLMMATRNFPLNVLFFFRNMQSSILIPNP